MAEEQHTRAKLGIAAQAPSGTNWGDGVILDKAECMFTSEPALCCLRRLPEAKPTLLPYPPNRMITRKFFEVKDVFSSGFKTVKNLLLS